MVDDVRVLANIFFKSVFVVAALDFVCPNNRFNKVFWLCVARNCLLARVLALVRLCLIPASKVFSLCMECSILFAC